MAGRSGGNPFDLHKIPRKDNAWDESDEAAEDRMRHRRGRFEDDDVNRGANDDDWRRDSKQPEVKPQPAPAAIELSKGWKSKRWEDEYWVDCVVKIVNNSKWTLKFRRGQGDEIIEKVNDGTDISPGQTVEVVAVGGHLQSGFASYWEYLFFEIPGYPALSYWCIRVGCDAVYTKDALAHHLSPLGPDTHSPLADRRASWDFRCGWVENLNDRGEDGFFDKKFTSGILAQSGQYSSTTGFIPVPDATQLEYTLTFSGDDFGRQ